MLDLSLCYFLSTFSFIKDKPRFRSQMMEMLNFPGKVPILRFYILGNFPFPVIKVPRRSSENLVLGFP